MLLSLLPEVDLSLSSTHSNNSWVLTLGFLHSRQICFYHRQISYTFDVRGLILLDFSGQTGRPVYWLIDHRYSQHFICLCWQKEDGCPELDSDDGRFNNWWRDACVCWYARACLGGAAVLYTHTVSFWALPFPVATSAFTSFNDLWLYVHTHTQRHITKCWPGPGGRRCLCGRLVCFYFTARRSSHQRIKSKTCFHVLAS